MTMGSTLHARYPAAVPLVATEHTVSNPPIHPTLSSADRRLATRFLSDHGPSGEWVLCAVVGSRLYGTARPDSDLDLKGIHQAPTERILQLFPGRDSHERFTTWEGRQVDLTTHELSAALRLLLKGNGNILERIHSPMQLIESEAAGELQALANQTLSKRFHGHYSGYFHAMQKEYRRSGETKPLLAAVRLALTGTLLLKTGQVECHIDRLADHFQLPQVAELAAVHRRYLRGAPLPLGLCASVEATLPTLEARLHEAAEASALPAQPTSTARMDQWLVRRRLEAPSPTAT